MRKRKMLSLLLAATTLSAALAGCGGKEAQVPSTAQTTKGAEGASLTYWCELTTTVSANFANLGETPFAKELSKETGTVIEFQHPPVGQLKQQFGLIMADGNLPDIMEYNWTVDYPGGPEKAIKDGVILPLNDIFEQYCPNIMTYLKENPEIDRMIKTDEGHYYVFPFVRGDEKLRNTIGLMLREDWLKELNLEVPTTIDEWHTVLTAFKEKKGAIAPFTFEYTNGQYLDNNPLVFAFDTSRSFYIGSDGKVGFGAVSEGYKQYLQTMAQWYKEGLIDPDLATLTNDQVSAKMTGGQSGASMGQAGSRMGTWINAAVKTTPEYMLKAAPSPSLEKGTTPEYGQVESAFSGRASAAITTSCKDVERAARLMDYAFSEEGHMLYNFGIEGESYTMADGYPTYTDLILKNPEGLPISQAMSSYFRGNYNGPFVQDVRYLEQYYTLEAQKETPVVWGAHNGVKHLMPPITPTSDESKEFSTIMNEINTYRDEMTLKFIFGTESMDNFDTYVKNINSMNLARALEIQNAALERYNAR